jgi:hypothetical protein
MPTKYNHPPQNPEAKGRSLRKYTQDPACMRGLGENKGKKRKKQMEKEKKAKRRRGTG